MEVSASRKPSRRRPNTTRQRKFATRKSCSSAFDSISSTSGATTCFLRGITAWIVPAAISASKPDDGTSINVASSFSKLTVVSPTLTSVHGVPSQETLQPTQAWRFGGA